MQCFHLGECGDGECCEDYPHSRYYRTCTNSPIRCLASGDLLNIGENCARSADCVTECCSQISHSCVAGRTACKASMPVWIVPLLAVLLVSSLLGAVLVMWVDCKCKKKGRRLEEVEEKGDEEKEEIEGEGRE